MKTIYTFPSLVIAASIFSAACQKEDTSDTPTVDLGSKESATKKLMGDQPSSNKEVQHVTAIQAAEYIKKNPATIILDVRSASEFSNGHIKDAINIDFKSPTFAEHLKKLDTSKTYLIHCQAGGRSTAALPAFKKLGFQHLLHLDGGMMNWGREQLPIEK